MAEHCKNPTLILGVQEYTKKGIAYLAAGGIQDKEEAIQSFISAGTIAKSLYSSKDVSNSYFKGAYAIAMDIAAQQSLAHKHVESGDRYSWAANFAKDHLNNETATASASMGDSEYRYQAQKLLRGLKENFSSSATVGRDTRDAGLLLRSGAMLVKAHGANSQDDIDKQLSTAFDLLLGFDHKYEALSTIPHMSKEMQPGKLNDFADYIKYRSTKTTSEEKALIFALDCGKLGQWIMAAPALLMFAKSLSDVHAKKFFTGMSADYFANAASSQEKTGIMGQRKQVSELYEQASLICQSIHDPRFNELSEKSKKALDSYNSWQASKKQQQVIEVK
ncbi:MAG: hypothetical protein KGH66_03150 [Candidatus Micrarchaeota archaeon]|nr:hypothetical protein [Candidatus Micrarchaeota archaeon]